VSQTGLTVVKTLLPGDVALGQRGDRLETLLGSCVSIVLTDPRRTVGTMCHIVHTRRPTGADRATGAFADVALREMAEQLQSRGIRPGLCEAYVFGGGNMFPQLELSLTVGDDNAAWALDALDAMGVRLRGIDLGGNVYRRLSWTVGPEAPSVDVVPV
jgi:chemotaxis protein CheD